MPVSVIPFNMPEPMEIPAHLVDMLKALPSDEVVMDKAMELLAGIEAAEIMIYERVDENGILGLGGVYCSDVGRAAELRERLAAESFYNQPLNSGDEALAAQAFANNSPLLIMGQVEAGETISLPAALTNFLLGGESGNIGFLYVLTLSGADQRPLGALTLVRPMATGPLNHEQPNIAEGLRRQLNAILEG
tara:strand:+ start:288 stop:860 length:573 start_codon:yes stop_codon:yes gene_type:complete